MTQKDSSSQSGSAPGHRAAPLEIVRVKPATDVTDDVTAGVTDSDDAPVPSARSQAPQDVDVDVEAGDAGAVEIGGPKGLEPTRYGDWERKGRCVDF